MARCVRSADCIGCCGNVAAMKEHCKLSERRIAFFMKNVLSAVVNNAAYAKQIAKHHPKLQQMAPLSKNRSHNIPLSHKFQKAAYIPDVINVKCAFCQVQNCIQCDDISLISSMLNAHFY